MQQIKKAHSTFGGGAANSNFRMRPLLKPNHANQQPPRSSARRLQEPAPPQGQCPGDVDRALQAPLPRPLPRHRRPGVRRGRGGPRFLRGRQRRAPDDRRLLLRGEGGGRSRAQVRAAGDRVVRTEALRRRGTAGDLHEGGAVRRVDTG